MDKTLELTPAQHPAGDSDKNCRLAVYQGLVRMSSLINSVTDYDAMLQAVIEVSREVFEAEASSLFLPTADGTELELAVATTGSVVEKPHIRVPKGQGIAWWVLEHREPVLIPDAYADARFYRQADLETGFRTRSILSAPLLYEDRPVAVLQLLNPRKKTAFDDADLEAINGYSTLLATALEKMRLIEARQKSELLRRDLTIAAEIQQGQLERAIAQELRGEGLFACTQPALEVGGDFYLATRRPQGDVWFAVGDVSGKGIAAAMLMTQAMDALRFFLRGSSGPASVLRRLNRVLQEVTVRGMFVTLVLGRWRRDGTLEMAGAGHCWPWLIPGEGTPAPWCLPSALPLGILPETRYEQCSLAPGRADSVLLFSDGLSESRAPGSQVHFDSRLPEVLARAPRTPEELGNFLLEEESRHRAGGALRDDLTLLILRHP